MHQIFDTNCVTNEHARVPLPSSMAGPSVNVEDDDLSGTEMDTQVTPGATRRGQKRPCPYSPSATVVERWKETVLKKVVCTVYVKYLRRGKKSETL